MRESSRFPELREAYQAAFRDLARSVRALRLREDSPNADAEEMERLRSSVVEALLAYRQCRDRLAALLLHDAGKEGASQVRARLALSRRCSDG
ncbi:MAG: hypothetical protein RMK57_06415 [Bryobacterales bacterium]|nr:hypothetical protein [Bryobacteraceae bacterium]MDW8354147.1 hypothetical protein [Bryobacterales bacterium]